MDDSKTSLDDLKQIRTIMERSSIFLSLSGFSGIIIGLLGIATSIVIAHLCSSIVMTPEVLVNIISNKLLQIQLSVTLLSTVLLALSAAFLFSLKKAKKKNLPIFNKISRSFALHFFIPLITGFVFLILTALKGYYELILPSTLIFYGLSLLNASKYTLREIAFLGIISIGLGILAMLFIPYSLIFWSTGFGVCTIIYGLIIYSKYEQ